MRVISLAVSSAVEAVTALATGALFPTALAAAACDKAVMYSNVELAPVARVPKLKTI